QPNGLQRSLRQLRLPFGEIDLEAGRRAPVGRRHQRLRRLLRSRARRERARRRGRRQNSPHPSALRPEKRRSAARRTASISFVRRLPAPLTVLPVALILAVIVAIVVPPLAVPVPLLVGAILLRTADGPRRAADRRADRRARGRVAAAGVVADDGP